MAGLLPGSVGLVSSRFSQEQERAHDQGRDVLEVREEHVQRPSVVERLAPEVTDDQPRHGRLAIGRRHTPSHEADRPRALARLLGHRVSGGSEPSAEIAESRIASLGVEGTAAREGDAGAQSGLDRVREARRVAREEPGLGGRRAELVVGDGGEAAYAEGNDDGQLEAARRPTRRALQALRRDDIVHTPT